MTLGQMLLRIVNIDVRRRELAVAKDPFERELVRTVHDCRYGSRVTQQMRMEARNAGVFPKTLDRLA